jgi:hypothetical protein
MTPDVSSAAVTTDGLTRLPGRGWMERAERQYKNTPSTNSTASSRIDATGVPHSPKPSSGRLPALPGRTGMSPR